MRSTNGRTHPSTLLAWQAFEDANIDIKMFAINSQIDYERKVATQLNTKLECSNEQYLVM